MIRSWLSACRRITASRGWTRLCSSSKGRLRRATQATQDIAWAGLGFAVPNPLSLPNGNLARPGDGTGGPKSGMALREFRAGNGRGVWRALGVHCQVPHGLPVIMLPAALHANRCIPESNCTGQGRMGHAASGRVDFRSKELIEAPENAGVRPSDDAGMSRSGDLGESTRC